MRILHLIDTLTVGGAQKLLVTFGQEARRRGIQADIACLEAEANSPVGKELQALGLPVAYFPAPHLMDARRLWQVEAYLRRLRPDVIQTHVQYANIVGGLTGVAAGIPVIATLHMAGLVDPIFLTDAATARKSQWRSRLELQVLQHLCGRVVAVGHKTAEVYRPHLGNKPVEVIPNGIGSPIVLTAEERSAVRREMLGDASGLWLISVGSLSPAKSYGDLIRAFASLHTRYPQAVLMLVGSGDQRSALETLAQSLGVAPSVRFAGQRGDVPRLLAASDLFLSSSVVEGMPLVVMEAMMAGLPVVATAVGDLPYMVPPECGTIVPPSQPERLAEAASALLADEEKRAAMGIQAQAHALRNFGSAAWVDKLLQLYEDVIARRRRT